MTMIIMNIDNNNNDDNDNSTTTNDNYTDNDDNSAVVLVRANCSSSTLKSIRKRVYGVLMLQGP